MSDLSSTDMDALMNLLVQIVNMIRQAYQNDVNGLARLQFNMAIILLEQVIMDLNNFIINLESMGVETTEVINFTDMLDIDSIIFTP